MEQSLSSKVHPIRSLDRYQLQAEDTRIDLVREVPPFLSVLALGLCSEAGEVADLLLKSLKYGEPVDRMDMLGELGDVLWFVANIATEYDLSLEDIAQFNIEKLRERHRDALTVS